MRTVGDIMPDYRTIPDNIKLHVGRCDGSIDELPFKDVVLAIDCTPGMDVRNHIELYLSAPN